MELKEALEQLEELQQKMFAYRTANSSLYLDGVTVAPKDTSAGRGVALGVLAGEMHKLFANPGVGQLLDFLDSRRDELDPVTAREVTVAPVIASTPPPTSASPEVPTNCTRKSMSVNAFRPRPKVSSRSRTTRPVTWPLLSTPVHWRMGPA